MSTTTTNINLKKAQLKNIRGGAKIAIIGMTESGKTSILKAIMKRFQQIPSVVVWTDTEDGNNNFEGTIPDSFIFEEWNEDFAIKLFERQKYIFKNKLTQEERNASMNGEITRGSILLILDDMGADSDIWGKSKIMKKFFMNGRNLGITIIITLQDPMDLHNKLRGQLSWTFILKEKSFMKRKKLYEHYASVIPYYDMFDQIMRNCTEDYNCLAINNRSRSYAINENLYWYKAQLYGKFEMGSDKYRKQHARKYNSKYGEEDNNKYSGRTKGKPKIRVTRTYNRNEE